jgi:hypothetical protein
MSRARDLFLQAAADAKPPFRRLYFDTEPLTYGNWPFVSRQLAFGMRFARIMGVELVIPQAALVERAEQWIRGMLNEFAGAQAKAKAAQKSIRPLGLVAAFQAPAEAELRAEYQRAEQKELSEFSIQQIPTADRTLDEVLRMAVGRDFTFEDTERGVVGFQDCVILLSVFDHLSANPTSAGLVSNDAIFSRIPKLRPTGLDLCHIRGLAALDKALDDAHNAVWSPTLRQWWDEESRRITEALALHKERVREFLEASIDGSEIEKLFSGTVVTIEPPAIESFGTIRPELEGEADEPIRFSSDIKVAYTAVVEGRSAFAALLSGLPPGESLPAVRATEHRTVTVELAAQLSSDYSDLKLQAARIRS